MRYTLYHTFVNCKCHLCHALQVDAVQRKLSAQQQHLHVQAKEERNRLQQQVQAVLKHVLHSSSHSPCALNVCATVCPMCGLLSGLPVRPQHPINDARSSSAIVRWFW